MAAAAFRIFQPPLRRHLCLSLVATMMSGQATSAHSGTCGWRSAYQLLRCSVRKSGSETRGVGPSNHGRAPPAPTHSIGSTWGAALPPGSEAPRHADGLWGVVVQHSYAYVEGEAAIPIAARQDGIVSLQLQGQEAVGGHLQALNDHRQARRFEVVNPALPVRVPAWRRRGRRGPSSSRHAFSLMAQEPKGPRFVDGKQVATASNAEDDALQRRMLLGDARGRRFVS